MQAEVDKYVVIAALMGRQRSGRIPTLLHHWLFGETVFDEALSEPELACYRDANHYAGKYCLQLEHRYLRPRESRRSSLINDLRRFYRLKLHDKIRRIERPH